MKKYLSIISKKTLLRCIGILVLALAGSVLASIWPVQLGKLYSSIAVGAYPTIKGVFISTATFGAIYLTAECIAIFRRVFLDCIIADHESEVRQNSIEKMLRMPVAYNFGHNSGEKTAQLNQGVAGLSQLVKILCNDVFSTILTAACTLVQVLMNAPGLVATVMFVYLILTIIISVFQIRSQNGIREQIIAKKNHLDGSICQSISNLELIRSLNAESYERKRLQPAVCNISTTEKNHHHYMGMFDFLKQACKVLFQVLVLALSVVMIRHGKMESGAVITVCLLFQQLVKPIDEVYRFIDETASSIVKAKVLTEVFNEEEDPVFSVMHHESEKENSEIILQDVLITDPQKSKALAHYDHLTIPGNRIVALTGPSGCGKSTLVRCLDRFYPYIRGSVHVFGKDLKDFTQAELTNALCYMPQNAFFFSGTVRDNLVYGLNHEVSDSELYDVLRKACILDSLLDKAIEGDVTGHNVLTLEVSEGGKNFSGGQRQRLTLARAFLRTPKLFIFDESTANLDGENMETVLNNLERHAAQHHAGIIYISHDDRVVKRCDQIIELHNLLHDTEHDDVVAA